jgi:hypothetical protein
VITVSVSGRITVSSSSSRTQPPHQTHMTHVIRLSLTVRYLQIRPVGQGVDWNPAHRRLPQPGHPLGTSIPSLSDRVYSRGAY